MSANGISSPLKTKEQRQIEKLEYSQAKRKGQVITEGSGTWSADGIDNDAVNWYRPNNTYDATSLPDTYNGNIPGADDNPNTEGLLPKRPWVVVGAIATPTSIAESVDGDTLAQLQIWYDAADITTLIPKAEDEYGITQWTDKSSYAHNANPPGGVATRPTYEDSFLKNGNGYLNFSGPTNGQYLTINPVSWAESIEKYTVFAVSRYSTGALNSLYHYITSSDTGDFGIGKNDATGKFIVTSSEPGGVRQHESDIPAVPGNWYLTTSIFDGTGSTNSDKLKLRVNKTLANITYESTVASTTYSSIDNISIGGTTNNQSESWEGDIAEIIIFTYVLTATEIANVENYLSNKWGL